MINGSVLFATFMAIDSPGAPPLDDDIVDRIMTFCPTFATLQSAILVSKAFHSVFQSHPKVSHLKLSVLFLLTKNSASP
jgi:hypothetical protein